MRIRRVFAAITVIAVIFGGCDTPDNPDTLDRKGGLLLKNGEWDAALECYEQLIDLDITDKRGYLGAAQAYVNMGNREEAVKILENGVKKAEVSDEIESELISLKIELWSVEVSRMNETAKDLCDEINRFLLEQNANGYTVKKSESTLIYFTVYERGEFKGGSPISNYIYGLPEAIIVLNDRLAKKFPNIRHADITAVFKYGEIVAALLIPAETEGVNWDWTNNAWVAEGALSNGVDKNEVIFGTYPPHTIQ